MPMNSLADYSTTPALNVDIGGISTDGATQTVNNVDNLIRELMSHLAAHIATPTFVGATLNFSSTDAGASSAPNIVLYRNSATPAANDFMSSIIFNGEDSAGNTQTYAEIASQIIDPTSTSEDGKIAIYTTIAGTAAARVSVGAGLSMAALADPGAGEIAVAGIDLAGVAPTINFGAGDLVMTFAANGLAFTGGSNGYTYDARSIVTLAGDGTAYSAVRTGGATGAMYVDTTAAWFGSVTNHPVYINVNNGAQTVAITATILGVGATTAFSLTSGTTDGAYVEAAGRFVASVSADSSLALRRRTSNGTIASFHRDTINVGTISVTTTDAFYNTASDARLKTKLKDFEPGAVLDAVKVYEYEWKEDGTKGFGPTAQELYEVFPQAVTPGQGAPGDDDYIPWGYDASKLVPVLIRELQDVRRRLDALEAKP